LHPTSEAISALESSLCLGYAPPARVIFPGPKQKCAIGGDEACVTWCQVAVGEPALLESGSLGEMLNMPVYRQCSSGELWAKLPQSLRQEGLYSWWVLAVSQGLG